MKLGRNELGGVESKTGGAIQIKNPLVVDAK
jgi:hypothetical protein